MLTIYSSRTHSYHLMANWLKDHQMPYRERIFTPKQPLTRKEIFYLLSLTENGFDDLLAKRSIDYKKFERSNRPMYDLRACRSDRLAFYFVTTSHHY